MLLNREASVRCSFHWWRRSLQDKYVNKKLVNKNEHCHKPFLPQQNHLTVPMLLFCWPFYGGFFEDFFSFQTPLLRAWQSLWDPRLSDVVTFKAHCETALHIWYLTCHARTKALIQQQRAVFAWPDKYIQYCKSYFNCHSLETAYHT